VRSYLSSCPGVAAMHYLQIWPLSTTENALTAHLVFPDGSTDQVASGITFVSGGAWGKAVWALA
jgi:Co/Zn/Cd efflux system component